MKLQYLAVIFIIIIMPIVMILSQYIDYQIDAIDLRHTYDTKLLEATYDSIKAYQLNTVNNAVSDIPAAKIEGLEAAVKTFYNTLTTNFNYTGYNSTIMKEYVPAVVFTMYDGYYIYSPYENVLTGVPSVDEKGDLFVDEDYPNNEILHGIKPYVYYSCRYKSDSSSAKEYDVVITYTLDNYITIQGTLEGITVNEHGYLIDGIEKGTSYTLTDASGDIVYEEDGVTQVMTSDYTYDGVTFKEKKKETLREYLGDKEYPYAKLNGTKYYINYKSGEGTENDNDELFYINISGEKAVPYKRKDNKEVFEKYEDYIMNNNSAYNYYKDSWKFTNWVQKNFGDLSVKNAYDWDANGDFKQIAYILEDLGKNKNYFSEEPIFGSDDGDDKTGVDMTTAIQDIDSSFNTHRSSIIRYTIEKNLRTAISGFKKYSKAPAEVEFIMPELSEVDWETLENNVSIITFLQGFNIAGRDYNSYCVVANNLTKEYVDENDIYILANNDMYYKPNDINFKPPVAVNIKTGLDYEPGIWKLNFERKNYRKEDAGNLVKESYYPIRVDDSTPYLGSYSSIINSTSVENMYPDLYKYMRNEATNDLKTVYYTALARERWGQYSVNNDIDLVQGNIMNPSAQEEIDTESPKVEIGASIDGAPYNGNWTTKDIMITGKAEDNDKITDYGLEENNVNKNVSDTNSADALVEVEYESKNSGKHEYRFYAQDESGNRKSKSLTVYIDKVEPSVSLTASQDKNKNYKLTGKIKDEHSGIVGYSFSESFETPDNYTTISPTTEEITIEKQVYENGTYYLHAIDKVGNTGFEEIKIENIDTKAPIITVDPSETEDVTKYEEIKITIEDDISGVKIDETDDQNATEKVTGQVALLTKTQGYEADEEGNPISDELKEIEYEEYYNYTAEKNSDGKFEAIIEIGKELTGEFELFVGGDISDNAGNITKKKSIGKFVFDNEAPQVESDMNSQEFLKNAEIKLNITDKPAGFEGDTIKGKYYLSTSAETNDSLNGKDYTAEKITNEKFEAIIKVDSQDLKGKHYIWIDSISDRLGNETGEILVGEVLIDNEPPIVTVEVENTYQSAKVTITLEDDISGLVSEDCVYYLSTSKSTNEKTDRVKEGTFTSGQQFIIEKDSQGNLLTGKYYLWVGDVEDKAGNVNKSHCIAELDFDNSAPEVTLTLEGTTPNSISVQATAVDSSATTAETYKYEYYILNPVNTGYTKAGENTSSSATDEFTYIENLTPGTTYSVYVKVTDKAGNSAESNVIEVKLADNYMIETGNEVQYKPTLADAISVASNGSKITLLNSIEDNSEVIIKDLKDIKIDLNGKTLTRNDSSIIINSTAKVEFTGNGYIKPKDLWDDDISYLKNLIINGGECIFNFGENGGIKSKTGIWGSDDWGLIHNIGFLTIQSGTIEQATGGRCIYVDIKSTIEMNGGKILHTDIGIGSNEMESYAGWATIRINNGIIEPIKNSYDKYGFGIYLAGDRNELTINKGTIKSKDGNAIGIYDGDGNIVNIYGGTIQSENNSAIYLANNLASINISSGLISGGKYGIYVSGNKGPDVTVGNGNTEYNKQSVIVEGGEHAMYLDREDFQPFHVYFHNGLLRTLNKDNEVLLGGYIQEIREGCIVIDEKDDTSHYKYLSHVGTNAMYAIENELYSTLQKAILAAENGDTIILLKDNPDDDSEVDFDNKDLTLLLNSYTLTKTTHSINIGQNASLTVLGNNGTIINDKINGFTVSGELNIYGGINMSTDSSSYHLIDTNADNAVIRINKGTFTANGQGSRIVNLDNKAATCYIDNVASVNLSNGAYGIYNSSNGSSITLRNMETIANSSYVIYNDANMECMLSDTDIELNNNSYCVYNTGISSGEITGDGKNYINVKSNSYGIYNELNSKVLIIDFNGHIYNDYGGNVAIYNKGSGNIEIAGGSLNGIINENIGNVKIKGGYVDEYKDIGILNTSTGKITVEGGDVYGSIYGIYNSGESTIQIKGGKVSTTTSSISSKWYSYKCYAIYNIDTNTKIIIGDKSKKVSTKSPEIFNGSKVSESIYTKAPNLLYFDNGKIINGYSSMYNDNVEPNIRYGYMIHKGTEKFGSKTGYVEYLVKDPSITEENIPPTVTVEPDTSEVCKNKKITITLYDDGGSGLKSDKGRWYLSTSRTSNNEAKRGTFTSGTPFTIGDNLTGTYYLWVGDIEDNAGNKLKEHFVGDGEDNTSKKGVYEFDNIAPEISNFTIISSTTNSISVEANATDSGGAGLYKYEYYISTNASLIGTLAGEHEVTSAKDTYTYENLTVGNTYYLTVIAEDKVGNESSDKEEIELIDNYKIETGTNIQYKPTLADAISVASNSSKIQLMKTITDNSEAVIDGLTNVTIDLNGNTLTRNEAITITENASVMFVGEGYIKTEGDSSESAIINGGTCTINFDKDNGILHNSLVSTIKNIGNIIVESGKLETKSEKLIEINGKEANLVINGGELLSERTVIYTSGEFSSITINDGIINSYGNYDKSCAILINKVYEVYEDYKFNRSFTINGGEILSKNNSAIYIYRSNLDVKILKGTISGGKYGIEVYGGMIGPKVLLPEIILGEMNKQYNINTPIIEGGQYAMYMDDYKVFNVYFYDGIMKTKTIDNEVILGAYIQEIEQGYSIMDEKNDETHYIYLNNVKDKMKNSLYYAIKDNDKLYETLQEAITSANSGDTIVLLKDNPNESSQVYFEDKDITLLLNSYTLTKTINTINIGANAKLTVTGNNATIINQNIIGYTVTGEIRMYGKVNISTTIASNPIFDTNAAGAIIDISNGTLKSIGKDTKIVKIDEKSQCYVRGLASMEIDNYSFGIYNSAQESNVYLEGGTISVNNNSSGIYNTSNMNSILSRGYICINHKSYAIYNKEGSSGMITSRNPKVRDNLNSLRVEGLSFTAISIYNAQNSNVSINLGKSVELLGDAECGIINNGVGDIVVDGGRIDGSFYCAIKNTYKGDITIKNGIVYTTLWNGDSINKSVGIYNTASGTITVDGGNIYAYSSSIYNTGDSVINIKKGNVNTIGYRYNEKKFSGIYHTIYNTNNKAKIIIGNKETSINTNSPKVYNDSEKYFPIYTESADFEFNNGRIESAQATMYNIDPIIRNGCKINQETSGEVYVEYLVKDPSITEDNIPPTVTVEPDTSEVCKNKEITITLYDDGGSGLKSNTGTWYLSTSRTSNNKAKTGIFTSGTPFTIGDNLTGTYYLWVGDVEDNAGNKLKEHFVGDGEDNTSKKGVYEFDNIAPEVTLTLKAMTPNSITVQATAVDSSAVINETYKYEYYIVYPSNTEECVGENISSSTTDNFTYTENLNPGATYKVYVKVTDKAGNSAKSIEIPVTTLTDNYKITTGNDVKYETTLADAISVASNDSKITLLNSIEDHSEAIIDNKTNITIDLNGKKLTRNETITITSNAEVTFIGEGMLTTSGESSKSAIKNAGQCTIKFTDGKGGIAHYGSSNYIAAIHNAGILNVESGIIQSNWAVILDNNSTFKMDGGNIQGNYVGIFIYGDNNILATINNGNIKVSQYGILYKSLSKANITINSGKIDAGTAIYLYNSKESILNVNGGTVLGENYGIRVHREATESHLPEVILGSKNNEYKQQPKIIGGTYAMYMDTTYNKAFNVYFYSGILINTTPDNPVLSGAYIQEIKEEYSIIDEESVIENQNVRTKYLKYVGTNALYAINDSLYNTLQDAVSNAKTGDTIVLLKNGTDSSQVSSENKDITLLLNSYKLTKTDNTINIGLNAKLTVTGNNATLTNQNITGFTVSGELKMYGIVNMTTRSSTYPLFDTNAEGAVIDINNGILIANGSQAKIVNLDCKSSTCYIRGKTSIALSEYAYGIHNSSEESSINLEGGNITVDKSYGVYNISKDMNCILAGTDMNINESSYAIYNEGSSTGKISSRFNLEYSEILLNALTSMGIYNNANSNISIEFKDELEIRSTLKDMFNNLEHARYDLNSAIYNEGLGDILIESGYYLGAFYGIQNRNIGDVIIKGGYVGENYMMYSNLEKVYRAGIYNTSNGKIHIENGTVHGYECGIYNEGNTTIDIKSGKVNTSNDNYQGKYAIYNANNNAKLIIGDNTTDVNTDNPTISSENTSNSTIYTNSTIEFNNGIIQSGNSGGQFNIIPSVRSGYNINYGTKQDVNSEGNNITLYTAYLVKK